MVRWLVTLGLTALAAIGAWVLAGRALDERARSAAASAWVDAELCLVGPGLASGARPSTRMRTIALGPDAARGWPKRCAEVARVLDDALNAPPLRDEFASAPRLTRVLGGPVAEREAHVDRLWTMLRDAALPAGTRSYQGVSPEPTVVVLKRAGLEVLASGFSLDAIVLDWSSSDEALRFLLPGDDPRWCRLDLTSTVPELRCLALGEHLPNPPRMPWAEAKAPEFLFGPVAGRAGFFDAAAGARIWSPPSEEADAIVRATGDATVLQAESDEGDEARHHWRLVRLTPGQPQTSRRIDLPVDWKALLFPEGIVWWKPDSEEKSVYFASIERERVKLRHTVGRWNPPKRFVLRCALGAAHAVLGEGGATRTMLIGSGKSFRTEELPKEGDISCYGGRVHALRIEKKRTEVRRCDARACRDESVPAPNAENFAAVPVGEVLVSVVLDSGGIGRSFLATPKGLVPNPHVLFEDASAGGLDVRAMRAVGGEKRGLLFLQDEERRVYALAFDANGEPTALATRPW